MIYSIRPGYATSAARVPSPTSTGATVRHCSVVRNKGNPGCTNMVGAIAMGDDLDMADVFHSGRLDVSTDVLDP